jgi:uncharacterized membrane protein
MAKRKSKQKARQAQQGGASAPAPAGGKSSSKAPVLKRRSLPNWPVLVPALVGMALTGYLTATSWLGQTPAYCTVGSSCDLVQTSRWGTFLGLPTAFWGFLGYATLAHIAFRVRNPEWHWKLAWFVAFSGFAVSIYLTVISLYVVQAACFYCLASLGLMAVLFGVVTLQRPPGLPNFSWPSWAGQTGLVVAIAVVALHLHYSGLFDSGAGPEEPYLRGLAQHLTRTGAVFYGAFW